VLKSRTTKFSLSELIGVAVIFLIIALWYAGPSFFANFNTGIPGGPVAGGVNFMGPGDHYVQYYRHLLPYYNLKWGHSVYFSGYEYNVGQPEIYTEVFTYFPFSILVSLAAFLIGPIAAFNLLIVLSFPLCGVSGYLLCRQLTNGSHLAGLIGAAVVALLPFRIGFLFGEVFYGTDILFLPLTFFLFLRFAELPSWRPALLFGASLFLFSTANFALCYLFSVFFFPYFALNTMRILLSLRDHKPDAAKIVVALGVPLLAIAFFLLYVKFNLDQGSLKKGHSLAEVAVYSPVLADFYTRWSGNETTIYLGLAGILSVVSIPFVILRRSSVTTVAARSLIFYAAVMFFLTYMVVLGRTFHTVTGIGLYEFLYNHLPGFNKSRTPGRMMPLVALCSMILVAVMSSEILRLCRARALQIALATVVFALIAWDMKFSSATMTKLDQQNMAYAAIAHKPGKTLALPVQVEGDNYLNSTFTYYAINNDLRMGNGHNSAVPLEWDRFAQPYMQLNSGAATRRILRRLYGEGFNYIVAHASPFEPHLSPFAVNLLDANPALRRIAADHGIVSYEIIDPEKAPLDLSGEDYIAVAKDVLGSTAGKDLPKEPGVHEIGGWYALEKAPSSKGFRWMQGKLSVIYVVPASPGNSSSVEFDYICPLAPLVVGGQIVSSETSDGAPGWKHMKLKTAPHTQAGGAASVITLATASVYTVPGDPREFGCMIGEFSVE
jgi:hypothetical protein